MRGNVIFWGAIAVLMLWLVWRFPHALSADNAPYFAYLAILLIFVASGRVVSERLPWKQNFKYLAIWVGIALVIMAGYSYRDTVTRSRLWLDMFPGHVSYAGDRIEIRPSDDGHFYLLATVNNTPVRFMIDTGASDIMLSQRDAKRIGIDIDSLQYSRFYSTANGTTRGARVVMTSFHIGEIFTAGQLPAYVNMGTTDSSLLGMEFLRLFSEWHLRDNTLVLTP